MRPGALFRLHVLAPAVLVLAGLADLGLRLVPLDRITFRSWEALRVGGEAGPFRPNHRYENARAYGDLANMGNVPELREYHREVVVTDAHGFRNPPALAASGRVRVLVMGSSFAAGTEVQDHETLASRLAQRLGVDVYNAALAEPDLASLRELARRTGMTRGVVVFEQLEGRAPPAPALGGAPRAVRCPFGVGDAQDPWCRAYNAFYERFRVSPMRVWSSRAVRRLQNDRWFPNPHRDAVLRAALRDGREMLFQGGDAAWRPSTHDEDRTVRYFTWLHRRLTREGLALVVVLVPRKYTVYAPLLAEPPLDGDVGARALERLARRLYAEDVPVVDLTAALREAATRALAAGRTVYFRDDTHWNAEGIGAAAGVLARRVAPLLPD
jgi:hypothetical protein